MATKAGFLEHAPKVVIATEALGVDLGDVLRAGRPRCEQPKSVVTLSPPMGAPLPGASVRIAVMGSPASSVAVHVGRSQLAE